ncbi:MAG TPA: hypothetical protein VFS43_18205 [Polyangiaceae bacterium]|nr:hypothetical protein [Polyangiaceae bacterium]
MEAIIRATARWAAATLGALGALVLLSATVRLLPWALAPDVAWGPLGVFARGVLVVGFETALLVSLPVAWALAAASLNDQGEARACLLTGASPWALARATAPLGLLCSIVMLWPSALWGRDASQSGVVVRGLVRSAREGCDPALRPVSEVPLARATWLCPPEGPARLVASLGTSLVASVEGVRVADDLRTLWADGVSLDVRGPPPVHLQARAGVLTGLPPFARAAGPSQKLRPWFVVAGALTGALSVMASLLRRGEARRAVSLGVGGASSACGLGLLVGSERLGLGPLWYAAVPAAMAAPPWLWQAGLTSAERWRRRRLLRGPLRPAEAVSTSPEARPPGQPEPETAPPEGRRQKGERGGE